MQTLEDIKGIYSNGSNKIGELHINHSELKNMAKDWITDLRNNLDENVPGGCADVIGLICWIQLFFNLEEF